MAIPVAESSTRNDIELPPAMHWPTVYAMAGIASGLAVVLLAVVLFAAAHGPPAPQPAEPAAPVAVVLPPPAPRPLPTAKPAAPAETAPADSGPPVWKPLVPHPTAVPLPDGPVGHPTEPDVPLNASLQSSAPPTPSLQRMDMCYDYQLLADLQRHAQEVDLETVQGTGAKLLTGSGEERHGQEAKESAADRSESVVDVIARRPDLAGLPVRGASECRLAAKAAEEAEKLSQSLRQFGPGPGARPRARLAQLDPLPDIVRDREIVDLLAKQKEASKEDDVPVLVQMLQVEGPLVRVELTKLLAAIKGRQAGAALAQRALFDLSPELRGEAIRAMKERPPEECRQTLLDGLRYPWVPVADHAAEALTALEDRGAVPHLEAMLDLPDPSAPVCNEKQKWVVPELVKVKHLGNCLLCHAPSASAADHVRGLVPRREQELPPAYYEQRRGEFVRADVTYLRQDFSLVERVANPDKWPEMQRFDYLVRCRELTDPEIIDMADAGLPEAPTYPQRDAVQFALKKLTAPDARSPTEQLGLGP